MKKVTALTVCSSSLEAASPNTNVAPPKTRPVATANAVATTGNHIKVAKC